MLKNKVIKVSRTEFQMENGDIFPIEPPLEKDITPEEFQIHYERAFNIIKNLKDTRCNDQNLKELGQTGENQD